MQSPPAAAPRVALGPILLLHAGMSFLRIALAALSVLIAPLALAAPEKWADAINKFTQADATNPPAHGGVVFVGSSSIVKWTTLQKDFPGLNVINRGFGGSELGDSAYYARSEER